MALEDQFREAVWRDEHGIADAQKFDPASLWDDHDAHGLHWVITAGSSIVAAARLCVHHRAEELPAENDLAATFFIKKATLVASR